MSIGEGNRFFGEGIKVRGFDARKILQQTDVIVQIVDRDEEDVVMPLFGIGRQS